MVNRTELDAYLDNHKQAVLGTSGATGRPQLSNVLAPLVDGRFLVSTTESTAKYRNLTRDNRATVLILGDNFWQYVVVRGEASILHMPDALPTLHVYYEAASGKPHPDWDEYDRAMEAEKRVAVSISIDHWSSFNA